MDPVVLAAVTLGLSGSGLASVIGNAARHIIAERNLVRIINRDVEDGTLRELESLRSNLTSEPPDPIALGRAVEFLTEIAQNLREGQKKDIINTLERGSERSTANYVVKLIDQIEKSRGNRPDGQG